MNPLSDHRSYMTQNSVSLSIKSDFIAHSMEKFQVLIDLDGLTFDEI